MRETLGFSLVLAVALAACGSGGETGPAPFAASREASTSKHHDDADDDDDDKDPPAKKKTTTTSDATEPAPKKDKPAPAECASETTEDACFACCSTAHTTAQDKWLDLFGACACSATAGNCAVECSATLCSGSPPDDACEACLGNSTACETKANTECDADAECAPVHACEVASACGAKG